MCYGVHARALNNPKIVAGRSNGHRCLRCSLALPYGGAYPQDHEKRNNGNKPADPSHHNLSKPGGA